MNNKQLKIYIFCCSNSFNIEEIEYSLSMQNKNCFKIIGLPCSGKVDLLYLIKAFETGADGTILLTCKEGECSYLAGNFRAKKRADAVDEFLEEIGMGKGRMQVIQLREGHKEEIFREIEYFANNLKSQSCTNIDSALKQS
ncbi:MAG: hydrogenase iron-sulfur subunit [Spirochaetota bacterium]